jgi:hypothetical protein
VRSPTIISAASAGTTFRPTRTYTTLRDVTFICAADVEARARARDRRAHVMRERPGRYQWYSDDWISLAADGA